MIFAHGFLMAAIAVAIEYVVGYPKPLFKAISHPVVWIGRLITWLDRNINRPEAEQWPNRLRGVGALLILCGAVILPALVLSKLLAMIPFGWLLNVLIATTLIAQKSMRDHVLEVAKGFEYGLPNARTAVAKIVGRDPATLDESGVSRAALESLAENTADGIIAPVLWYAIFGLPGIAFYKAVNTADSMIGHKSARFLNFGWASARLDDLINLPASRLTGLFFAAATLSKVGFLRAVKAMWRDASKHGSPNAGWPEAAMAGALNLRFGGPRAYQGEFIDLPWMGDGRHELSRQDIHAGIALFDRAMIIQFSLLVILAVFL